MNFLNLLSTFLITSVSLFALKPMASRIGLIDIPGGRKDHKSPTPLVGGLGIYVGILLMTLFTPTILIQYSAMLAISGVVLLVGIFDDARELRVSVRMGAHAFAAWLMAAVAGNQLLSLGNILAIGPIELGIMAIPLTVFATVGVVNAVNMTDGIDGLSGGLVLIALFFLGTVAYLAGNIELLQFSTLLICSLLAFLVMNFRLPWKQSALIYLGDAGSTMLGFVVAWLLIEATQGTEAIMSPVYALWFLALPLMDTVSLMVKRPLQGLSPFAAGTDHLHHRLLRAGYPQEHVVMGLYLVSAVLGCIGLAGYVLQASEVVMFLLFIGIFVLYSVWGKLWRMLQPPRMSEPARE